MLTLLTDLIWLSNLLLPSLGNLWGNSVLVWLDTKLKTHTQKKTRRILIITLIHRYFDLSWNQTYESVIIHRQDIIISSEFQSKIIFNICILRTSSEGIAANVVDCIIVVSEFGFMSRYYISFRTYAQRKSKNSPIFLSYRFSTSMAFPLNNPQWVICN